MVDIVTWQSHIGTFVQRTCVQNLKVHKISRDVKSVVPNVYFILFVVSVEYFRIYCI